MRRRHIIVGTAAFAALTVVFALAGCGEEAPGAGGAEDDGAVVVLAKADGWREGLQDATDHPFALVEIVADSEVERAWNDNVPGSLSEREGDPAEPGIYSRFEDVDFEQQVLVVFSSGESGTCPVWVRDLAMVDGRLEVNLDSTAGPGEPCTDDFRPYRLVLAVDRDRLPGLDDLPVDGVDVPSENLYDVSGLVAAYPAG